MKMNDSKFSSIVAACAGVFLALVSPAMAGEPDPQKEAVNKTAAAFVDAFHSGDAKAVAAFWTTDGDFVDLEGRVLKGRAAIEEDFADLFKQNKGLKLRIEVANVRFPAPDVAIEDGTTSVIAPDGSVPNRARYTNVLVKKDGKWLLASVREAPYVPPTNRERLRGLEWMIGEWTDQTNGGEGHSATVAFNWTPDSNYIYSVRAVHVNGLFLDNGTQRIGWDPAAKTIRSWNFECDGGFGESVWTKTGDNTWTVKTNSVIQSGHKVTATTTVTQVDADTVTWQTKEQTVDGKPLPDSPLITMKRVK